MKKEILEQPDVINRLIKKYIKGSKIAINEFKGKTSKLKNIKRIIFLGCGSSYYAGLIGNYIIEELASLNCEVEFSDEFVSRLPVVEDDTLVIALSQSGKTTDVIQAVRILKNKAAMIVAITNTKNSKLADLVDINLNCLAGKEKAVAATKSFLAQIFMLYLIAFYLGEKRGEIKAVKMKQYLKELKELPKKITSIFQQEKSIKKYAKEFSLQEYLVLLGKKYNYPIALEGAQKIKETTYIPAEGYASDEFLHGPCALVDENFLVIIIIPPGDVFDKKKDVLDRLKKMQGKEIIITSKGKASLNIKRIIYIPRTNNIFYPFLTVVPLQLLSFFIAVEREIEVDQPRNISKYIVELSQKKERQNEKPFVVYNSRDCYYLPDYSFTYQMFSFTYPIFGNFKLRDYYYFFVKHALCHIPGDF